MAAIQTTSEMFAAINSRIMSRAPAVEPVSAEQAKATRAALGAKFRAGETVMNRDCKGQFTGAVKVATFGGVEVPLSRGQVALIDEADLERVSRHNWHANPTTYDKDKFYAVTSIKGATTYLHRFILEAPKGLLVDHRNRDTLDCRRANLRLATRVQNNVNRLEATTQPYRGIERLPLPTRCWRARIQVKGRQVRLGRFWTAEEAARAYDAAARKHYGEFAMLNFPQSSEA